jgi:hypothetical protein
VLEKLLPVLNGLIYLKQENREAILTNIEHISTLFEIFRCQLPIELHENALFAILNLFQSASKQVKEFLVTSGVQGSPQKQGKGSAKAAGKGGF